MDLDALRDGRTRRRRRLAAAVGLLTLGVVTGSTGAVADVEAGGTAPKTRGPVLEAGPNLATDVLSPPVVIAPAEVPDALSRGS